MQQEARTTQKPRAKCRQEDGRVWLQFSERPNREVRAAVKAAGYQFSASRGAWFTYTH